MERYKAGIVGVTGYVGQELLRILRHHLGVSLDYLITRNKDLKTVGDIAPHLSHLDMLISHENPVEVAEKCDVLFLALPHGLSQDFAKDILRKTRVIDLASDFRIQDADLYKKYYGHHKNT